MVSIFQHSYFEFFPTLHLHHNSVTWNLGAVTWNKKLWHGFPHCCINNESTVEPSFSIDLKCCYREPYVTFWLNHDVDIHGVSKAVFIRVPCYVSLPVDHHSHSWFQPNRGKVLGRAAEHCRVFCIQLVFFLASIGSSGVLQLSIVSVMKHNLHIFLWFLACHTTPISDSDVCLHFVHNTTMTLLQGNMSLGLHLSTLNDSRIASNIEANVSLNTGGRFGNGKGRWNVSLRHGSKTAPVCTECLCVSETFELTLGWLWYWCSFFLFTGYRPTGYSAHKRCQKWKVHQNAKGKPAINWFELLAQPHLLQYIYRHIYLDALWLFF